MRGYVVALQEVSESLAIANRCIESGAKFGIEIEMRRGVWREFAMAELKAEGLKAGVWDHSWSNTPAVIGNFVAQYRIWREIMESSAALVFEHDAVVTAPIPSMEGQGDIVNLGRPSFGKVRMKDVPGFYPLFSTGDKIPGAHGYYLTPRGAADLVAAARKEGAMPVDKFINPQRFPDIREYWPWPIVADDSFTTIQREKGCRSKHNYRDGYRIL